MNVVSIDGLALFACCALVAWAALVLLLRSRAATRWAIDVPNDRSLHALPTPRIGGLVVLAVALPVAAWLSPALRPVAALALLLAVVSAIDDRRGLSVRVRLAFHIGCALVAAVLLLPRGSAPWLPLAIGLAIVWAINLYNFMDGADGMAGGMAVIGFGALSVAAGRHDPALALACLAVAGASAGFLVLNFQPARVFLGDAGSAPLGFLAASLGTYGHARGIWPAWYPLLVFLPFVVDATLTLLARIARGERFWVAHRDHCYQRMVGAGLSHGRTALAWYAAMAASAAAALLALGASALARQVTVAVTVAVSVLLWFAARRHFGRHRDRQR